MIDDGVRPPVTRGLGRHLPDANGDFYDQGKASSRKQGACLRYSIPAITVQFNLLAPKGSTRSASRMSAAVWAQSCTGQEMRIWNPLMRGIHLSWLITSVACQFWTLAAVIGRGLQNDVGRFGRSPVLGEPRHHQRAAKISRRISGPIELGKLSGDGGGESSPACLGPPLPNAFFLIRKSLRRNLRIAVYPPDSQHSRSRTLRARKKMP